MTKSKSVNLMRSIQGGTEESTEALRLQFYLDELQRQAEIASTSLTRGWLRALQADTAENDAAVWGDLQSALFAVIVIRRILGPGGISNWPKETKKIREALAKKRAAKLRELLMIPEGSPLLNVASVRDSFEHFDERLDAAFLNNRASLVDWHISEDGVRVKTPVDTNQPVGEALRQFFPASGTLHFGDVHDLDLFALDRALLELAEKVKNVSEDLAPSKVGPYTYGVFGMEPFDLPDRANARVKEWFYFRAEHGRPIDPGDLPS